MLACVQASKEQAKQIEASIQKAFAKLSAWEDSIIHAKDLRSLAAVSLPQRLWDRPESPLAAHDPGHMAVPTPSRTGFAGQPQALVLAEVPTEDTTDASAALELLQEDVASAAACTLAPQGRLMFSSVMSAVIVRPHVVTTSWPPHRNPHSRLRQLARQAPLDPGGAIKSVCLVSKHPPLLPPHGRHISLFSHVPDCDTNARKGATAVLGIGEFPDDLATADNLYNLQNSLPAWSRVSALHLQLVLPVHILARTHFQLLGL